MLLGEVTTSLPTALYASLPFWPLLGAIIVGILIALRQPAERAHWPVVIGVGISALLGVAVFFDFTGNVEAKAKKHLNAAPAAAAVQLAAFQEPAAEPPPDAPSASPSDPDAPEDDEAGALEVLPGAPDDDHHPAEQHGAEKHGAEEHGAEHGKPDAIAMIRELDAGAVGLTYTFYNWISLGNEASLQNNQWIALNFYFDNLTGVMLLFFTVVALMVVIYAIGYMRDHHGTPQRGYERFFAFLGLFVFSMGMLVLSGNFVLLYLGWEAVGLCSYLLIGFHYKKPSAAAAAKKAFLVNRIGDLGFALGIFSIYMFIQPHLQPGENPLDYEIVFKYAHLFATTDSGFWGMSQATVIALLLMCGALGKSAQFPLYVWLPDAMEGPTPVSALIHAATMVTAGIYMIARCGPIFAGSPFALDVIVVLGLIGAILAATIAMAQYDMKRILAYSTISQLAFMFVALGVGAPDSAVFHVFTHAFFKALLFLCAGSVMHAMGDVIDLRHFSGLKDVLPKTHRLMLIGCLALAGFPLLAGFWSKDEIVHYAFEYHWLVGLLLLFTAGLTAYYTFRMYFLCFHGPKRLPPEAGDHPHESPPAMINPLYVLAFGAIFAGYFGVYPHLSPYSFLGFLAPHGYYHDYLHHSTVIITKPHSAAGSYWWLMYVSAAVAIAGIALAWRRYGSAPQDDPDARAFGPVFSVWYGKYWVDEAYNAAFVAPLRGLGRFFFATDRNGIDGLIWLVAAVPKGFGAALRFMQVGAVQGYALGMLIGISLLLIAWRWMEAGTPTS